MGARAPRALPPPPPHSYTTAEILSTQACVKKGKGKMLLSVLSNRTHSVFFGGSAYFIIFTDTESSKK